MAKKPAKPKAESPDQAPPGGELDAIIDAGLAEAEAIGWRNVVMEGVAARAALPLGAVLTRVPTRTHLVLRFLDRIDQRMLAGITAVDRADSPRDRLFDVTMRRFDALNAARAGTLAMIRGLFADVPSALAVACRTDRTAALMLGAAGISADGLIGCARIQGFKLVLACALRTWMDDDSEDLAKTMAALDRALARAERFATFRPGQRAAAA